MPYLFLYLSEDYVEDQQRITSALLPALEGLARDLEADGALVRTFRGHEGRTLAEVMEKDLPQDFKTSLRQGLPYLLIIDKDFAEFNPNSDRYLGLSLRSLISNTGDVDLFTLRELFTLLVQHSAAGTVFESGDDFRRALTSNQPAIVQPQIQVGPLGVSLDRNRLRDRRSRRDSVHEP